MSLGEFGGKPLDELSDALRCNRCGQFHSDTLKCAAVSAGPSVSPQPQWPTDNEIAQWRLNGATWQVTRMAVLIETLIAERASAGSAQGPKCSRCGDSGRDTYVDPASPTGFTERACPLCSARGQTWEPTATIDGRCSCSDCRGRTENIYRMIGRCTNCGVDNFLLLFRAGDKASYLTCPRCGCWKTVMPYLAASEDQIPAPALPAPPKGETP